MIKKMHEVIVQIADTAHQQQMSLSKYIEVLLDRRVRHNGQRGGEN